MKRLIQIILVGAVLFMGISVLQEWQVFFGGESEEDELAAGTDVDAEVEGAVRGFVSMVAHYYQSGGDPRFAERLAASERVVSELAADAEYLRANGRVQIGKLMRLDMSEVRRVSRDRAIVRTVEYWVIETRFMADRSASDPVRSEKIFVEYWLNREGTGWTVDRWQLVDEPQAEEVGGQNGDDGEAG